MYREYLKAAAANDLCPDLQQLFAEARQLHIAMPHILRVNGRAVKLQCVSVSHYA